jgi:hypothetical protein
MAVGLEVFGVIVQVVAQQAVMAPSELFGRAILAHSHPQILAIFN